MRILNLIRKIFRIDSSPTSITPKEFEILQRENDEARKYAMPSTGTSMSKGRFQFLRAQSQPTSRIGLEGLIIEKYIDPEGTKN